MGRRGPPKKTSRENQVNGNPGKRAPNKQEPDYQADETMPACPAHIKGTGKTEWYRIGPALIEFGTLRKTDMMIFTKYCEILSDHDDVRRDLEKTPNSATWLADRQAIRRVIEMQRTQMRHYAQELGITPASRASVKATRPKGKAAAAEEKPKPQDIRPTGNVARFFDRKKQTAG